MRRYIEFITHPEGLLVAAIVLALAGCATSSAPVDEAPLDDYSAQASELDTEESAAAVEDPPIEEARTYALPDDTAASSALEPDANAAVSPAPPVASASMNSAPVVALLNTAETQARSGDADQAVATIERAVRIEPRNPWLWHRLAVLRMQQGRYEQAIGLATRSNSLANGDSRLLDGNRQVIEQCRKALTKTQRG